MLPALRLKINYSYFNHLLKVQKRNSLLGKRFSHGCYERAYSY